MISGTSSIGTNGFRRVISDSKGAAHSVTLSKKSSLLICLGGISRSMKKTIVIGAALAGIGYIAYRVFSRCNKKHIAVPSNNRDLAVFSKSSHKEIDRSDQLKCFDEEKLDYGTTVNFEGVFRMPLLFSCCSDIRLPETERETSSSERLKKFESITLSFEKLKNERDQKKYSIELINEALENIQNLSSENTSRNLKIFLTHYYARFLMDRAYSCNQWDDASRFLDQLRNTRIDKERIDKELHWYISICDLVKFDGENCTNMSSTDAKRWAYHIKKLDPKHQNPLLTKFISVYQKKASDFPDYTFLQEIFSDVEWMSQNEIEGTFSKIASRFVEHNAKNQRLLKFDVADRKRDEKDKVFKRFKVDFSEKSLCLGQTEPFYFDISNYGNGSSLRSFFAQYGLMQLSLMLSDHPNLIPENNLKFQNNFFNGLRKNGWANSTGELVFPLDEKGIKQLYVDSLQEFFRQKLADTEGGWLFSQLEQGKRQYDKQLEHLSGFVQHEAIALFIKALMHHKYGVADEKLHQDMIRSLKNCLQLRLRSIDISYLDEKDQNQAWDDLSQQILDYLNSGNDILLPSGSSRPDEKSQSRHAIYVAIRHVQDDNHLNIVIMNGGEGCIEYHTESGMQDGEMKHYYYKQSGLLNIRDNQDVLKTFIRIVLSLPHGLGSFSELYENLKLPLMDHPKIFPLQLMGSCAIHNLKYGLKLLYGFSENEMGDMMRSGIMGIDELSLGQGDVDDLESHPLQLKYLLIEEVERVLKISKKKNLQNLEKAMKNKKFVNGIKQYYEEYGEAKVKKIASQLFSATGEKFESLEQFLIELGYDLETKSVGREPLTLQAQYMTQYGWNRAKEAKGVRPEIKGNVQNLKLYRTMSVANWEKLEKGVYSVLQGGHIGDFKQALKYFIGKSDDPKVMVEFILKEGSEKKLFSSQLAFPKKKDRTRQLKCMASAIGGDSFPLCNTDQGTSSKAIGIKSEDEGEAGFSIGIGGGDVPSQFKSLVESAVLKLQ